MAGAAVEASAFPLFPILAREVCVDSALPDCTPLTSVTDVDSLQAAFDDVISTWPREAMYRLVCVSTVRAGRCDAHWLGSSASRLAAVAFEGMFDRRAVVARRFHRCRPSTSVGWLPRIVACVDVDMGVVCPRVRACVVVIVLVCLCAVLRLFFVLACLLAGWLAGLLGCCLVVMDSVAAECLNRRCCFSHVN